MLYGSVCGIYLKVNHSNTKKVCTEFLIFPWIMQIFSSLIIQVLKTVDHLYHTHAEMFTYH